MNKDELWRFYCEKNAAFAGEENITLTARGLRKLFDTTWDAAHKKGVANGRALAAMEQKKAPANPFKEFFG